MKAAKKRYFKRTPKFWKELQRPLTVEEPSDCWEMDWDELMRDFRDEYDTKEIAKTIILD